MNNKLYVGNLSYSTGDDQLRRAFGEFGTLVSVAVVSDRMTGQPRGFGFVEYERPDDAQKAIDALNGQQLDGRTLSVNVARDREPKPRFSGGGGDGDFRRGGADKGSQRGGSRW